jgi:hypothetical protein
MLSGDPASGKFLQIFEVPSVLRRQVPAQENV